jgi:streptogrisin C
MRRLLATTVVTAVAATAVLTAGVAVMFTEVTGGGTAVPAGMLAALGRDLHLTAAQAAARLAADDKAARSSQELRTELGDGYGGAWLTPDASQVVVAVTDERMAAKVRAAGAQPKVVARSEADLDAVKATLDRNAGAAPGSVAGWHVDVVTNTVVVDAVPGMAGDAEAFARASGLPAGTVRVVADAAPALPLDNRPAPVRTTQQGNAQTKRQPGVIRGGDAYLIDDQFRCSIGFAVVGGFVSAGHCGQPGSSVTDPNDNPQGMFVDSSFPGNDYSWVMVNPNWTPRGLVNDYRGGTVRVTGSREAPVGSTVCRSGSTSGWHCGTVQAKNASVRYPQGLVTGLTKTDACAEHGDSGGSWLTGTQAQGVTSGGSGDCTHGGTTYFQPVNEILDHYGLRLVTA